MALGSASALNCLGVERALFQVNAERFDHDSLLNPAVGPDVTFCAPESAWSVILDYSAFSPGSEAGFYESV
jgi:hypothetical protein